MDKNQILAEIRRTATENGGVPLGVDRFSNVTGMKESDWRGRYWVRWSDAIREAGLTPNTFNQRASDEDVFERVAMLTRELGHYPTVSEMRLRKRQDAAFPDDRLLYRRGRRPEVLRLVVSFCEGSGAWDDVRAICTRALEQSVDDNEATATANDDVETGYVYLALMRVGREKRYKIGKADIVGRRTRQIGPHLPEELELVHVITTDDAYGIEAYWHRRFADKRRGGEWFELIVDDVRVFKRRRFM
jgi:hypothetical protein